MSVMLLPIMNRIVQEVVMITAYSSMKLNNWKEVVRAALPSIKRVITQRMSCTLLVKGAAIEASA